MAGDFSDEETKQMLQQGHDKRIEQNMREMVLPIYRDLRALSDVPFMQWKMSHIKQLRNLVKRLQEFVYFTECSLMKDAKGKRPTNWAEIDNQSEREAWAEFSHWMH
jgi:hypothetical protein